ncbi:retrotransposon protein, putative, ty1-copia subclass, partial [Tanacetum coccineum]
MVGKYITYKAMWLRRSGIVKTAFLNGKLTEDVFMAQPEGFENEKYPKRFGFSRSEDESGVYVKVSGSVVVFLVLYVDDILLIGNDIPTLQSVKDWLGICFAIKDLGDATYILGIKIYRDRTKLHIGLSEDTYLDKILKRFRMENSKKGNLPLHYGIKISKDLCPKTDDELDKMSRNPGEGHWTAVKNILRYLRNTKDRFLVYSGEKELRVTSYCDAGWQTDKDDSRSQSGWVFLQNGGAVTLKSSKQNTILFEANKTTPPALRDLAIRRLCFCTTTWKYGTSGATILQIHGAAQGNTTLLLRIYNGDMRYYNGEVIASDLYDKWYFKVNLIHNVDKGRLTVYINDVEKFESHNQGPGDLNFKCGVYGAPSDTSKYMESRNVESETQ